ncbi:TPA: accessory Sec system protein Asp1 [Streptococcus suis]|nr:accessory Sec system protein Asp1 [Streptococcus suis]
MYYFIPAWYHPERTWYDNTNVWYRQHLGMTFDDTINQIRMFQHANEKASILILNYMPHLRYFAHRYDLLEVPTWSVFDEIQDISTRDWRVIQFRDLKWPSGVEFIYTPFLVVARKNGERLAQIEFGASGQLFIIDWYEDSQRVHQYVFDDRGFLSSILYFENGIPSHQDYLNPLGNWQIREYLGDKQCVEVNPKYVHRFSKQSYACMTDLISEKLAHYFKEIADVEDTLILASDNRHNQLVLSQKNQKKVILSFFQNRYDLTDIQSLQGDLDLVDLVITDKLSTKEILEKSNLPIEHISPFDTRLSLGKSQRLKDLNIYCLVDGLDDEILDQMINECLDQLRLNAACRLQLISYQRNGEQLKTKLTDILDAQNETYFHLSKQEENPLFGIDEDEEEEVRVSFSVLYTETEIMEVLDNARIIIDLSKEPDLYTQIAGISAGIPQINAVPTEFVEHQKNGYQLADVMDLGEALRYYLTGLAHWNQALVYSVQKISDYTSGQWVERMLTTLENTKHE